MKKTCIYIFLLGILLVLTGCSEEDSNLMMITNTQSTINNITQSINVTNNITQSVNTTFNITNNITTTNNITNNIINNITTQFSGLINNTQLNTTNTGVLGQYPAYAGNGQFTWTTDQTGSGGSSELNIYAEYTRKIYAREQDFESVTAGYTEPWAPTAISAGTSALIAGAYNHPGTASMSTSTTASSGYAYQITGATTYLIGPNYTTSVTFKPVNKTGNITSIRFGFMDAFALVVPVDGVYFNLTQINASIFEVTGAIRNNNVQYNSSFRINITASQWYAMNIYIRNTTFVELKLWNETGTLLYNSNITGIVPTTTGRETSHAFVAYTTGGTTGQIIANIDFMTIAINQTLTR